MPGPNDGDREIYRRQLPGGGYASIRVSDRRDVTGRARFHGELVVERRVEESRRTGHTAPAVAQAEGESATSVLHALFPLATSNTLVAAACLARTRHSLPVTDQALNDLAR
jgi:hypothetical protein